MLEASGISISLTNLRDFTPFETGFSEQAESIRWNWDFHQIIIVNVLSRSVFTMWIQVCYWVCSSCFFQVLLLFPMNEKGVPILVVILTGWIQNQLVRVFNRLVSSIMGYSESDPWLNTFVDFHWMSPNHNKQKLSPVCLFTCINTLMSKKPVYTTLNTDRVLHRGTVFVYINFLFIVSEIFCSTIQRWVAKRCCLKYGFRMSGDQCQVWRLNTGAWARGGSL